MDIKPSHNGHSAQVKIWLLVDGASIEVAQLGPDFLLLDAPVDHPPGPASIVLRVDDSERCWDVHLPDGISAHSDRVLLAASMEMVFNSQPCHQLILS